MLNENIKKLVEYGIQTGLVLHRQTRTRLAREVRQQG